MLRQLPNSHSFIFGWNTQWIIHSHSLQSPYNNKKQTMFSNLIIRLFKSANSKATSVMKHQLKHLSFQKLGTSCAMCTFLRYRSCNHNYSLQPEVSPWGISEVWDDTLQAEKPFLKYVDLHSQHMEKTIITGHSSVEINLSSNDDLVVLPTYRKKATDTHYWWQNWKLLLLLIIL